MPRGVPNQKPVEKASEEVKIENPPEQGPAEPAPEYVTREEHDNAVRALRDEVSDLKTRIADVETLATQPSGAIEWLEVARPGGGEPDDGVPEYNPNGVQESLNRGEEDAVWYSPRLLE